MRLVWTRIGPSWSEPHFATRALWFYAERFGRVRTRKCNKDVPRAFTKADVDDVAEENHHEV